MIFQCMSIALHQADPEQIFGCRASSGSRRKELISEAMEPTQSLRAGIIGAGMISDIHISGLQRLGVDIVGIADADRDRARAKADRYGIGSVYASQRELLEASSPDVVHLLTPPSTHAALCEEAFAAGAHVYVEKPMAATVEDCDRMIAAAQAADRLLCVGHCLVYDPQMRRARDVLRSGVIGELRHASAVYTFDPSRIPGFGGKAWYRELGGGFLEDLAAHPASLLIELLGEWRHAHAVGGRRTDEEPHEVSALLEGDGASGALYVSLGSRPEEVSIDLRGTRGTVRVNFSTMVTAVQKERAIPKKLSHGVKNLEMAAQLATQTVTSTVQFLRKKLDATKGIHTLIGAFYEAIASGTPAPVSGTAGREVVRLLRAIWPSQPEARPKRWVLSSEIEQAPAAGWTALVTGATGFIGAHLVRTLADRGVRVRALARNPSKAARLSGPNVEVVIGDVGDPEVIRDLCDGVDVVFHLASVMRGPWEEFERVDVRGGRALIAEAERAGVRRFVFTSTMGAYALAELRDGAVVTEDMIDEPDRVGPYARAKLIVERMLMEAHQAGRIEAVITRPGLVFGPGTSPYLEHLPHLGSKRGDRYITFGDGRVPLQLTYVGNTVEALWKCATVPDAAGHTFTIIDDELPTQREFVSRLADLTGRPLRVAAIPRAAAYLIGAGVEGIAGLARKKAPTTRRLLLGKTVKLAFDTSRAKRVLGWSPEVSWQEGLRRAVEAAPGRTNGG